MEPAQQAATQEVPAAARSGPEENSPCTQGPLRALGPPEVARALDLAAGRLGGSAPAGAGSAAWLAEILRSWAVKDGATPAGQALSPEVANAGISAWSARKQAASRVGSGRQQPQPPQPPTASVTKDGDGRHPATPLAKRPLQLEETAAAPADAASTFSEKRRRRQEEEARNRELTRDRMQEVMREIEGHMEDVLRARGPEALEAWRASPPGCDRRERYTRLVHAVQDADVQQPEQLHAELLPHQVEGLEWLASLYANGLHGILADEMGLGKTIQTIALLLHLEERKGNMGPHLIVVPKSTLSNWQQEFKRFAPHFTLPLLAGLPSEREAELEVMRSCMAAGRPVACVTNYEQVYRNEAVLKQPWQLIVVDEGHRLKNTETVLHAAMAQMHCRMRLLLTGTPLQNTIGELWALLHYLLPDLFTCMVDFKSWFARPFRGTGLNEYEIQLEPEQEHEVVQQMHALLAPFLLQRLKSEVLVNQLPPRVELTVRVPMSAWQQAAYEDLERRTIRMLGDGDRVTSEQLNNALMQLRKIALHPYLFQNSYSRGDGLYRSSGKAEALDRLLPKLLRFGHKVLIFSQFTSALDVLETLLEWRGIASVRLDGQVPHEQRRERIARFNSEPNLQVFLLSARAGGLGLNLQAADTVVLFDLDWNPQNDKQAVARVHRVGQTREVRVVRLVTDSPVERHIERRCAEKLELEQKVMGAGMFRRQATAEQRGTALRAVLGLDGPPGGAAPGGGVEDEGLMAPEELSRHLARSPEELAAFEAMDSELLGPPPPASGIEDGGVAARLARAGRLLRPEEVPRGFTGGARDD